MLNLKTLLVVACALAYGEEEDAALLRFETLSLPIVVVFEGCGGVEVRNFFCGSVVISLSKILVSGHVKHNSPAASEPLFSDSRASTVQETSSRKI